MGLLDRFSLFSMLDMIAVGVLVICWIVISWWIENAPANFPSVTKLMSQQRRVWMREFVTRDPRIFDAQIVGNLRQGTSFFASACMIAIGGAFALLGNTEEIRLAARDLTTEDAPSLIFQAKLILVVLLLTHAFLKFVWSNRLFGYCSVLMAAVPNDIAHPEVYARAGLAAEMNIRAAMNFNRGLRSIYFALGSMAWLFGPVALLIATAIVTYLIWSREFYSIPRDILLNRINIEQS